MTDDNARPDTRAETRTEAPWHLWVVATVALLFTAFGAYDYVMSQSGDLAYMQAMVEPMGVPAEAGVAYFANFPLWADLVWAIGVWAGVGGAVLLLLRRALAYRVWLASLAGLVLSNAYGLANPIPGMTDTSMTYAMIAVVFAVMLALTLYARSLRDQGVLG